jgi:hypothetical protein
VILYAAGTCCAWAVGKKATDPQRANRLIAHTRFGLDVIGSLLVNVCSSPSRGV